MDKNSLHSHINGIITRTGWNGVIMGGIVLAVSHVKSPAADFAAWIGTGITLLAFAAGFALAIRSRFHNGALLTIVAFAELAFAIWNALS